MDSCAEKCEITGRLAVTLSRIHELLMAEKDAVRGLDRARMDDLEANIEAALEERNALLVRLRDHLDTHGC